MGISVNKRGWTRGRPRKMSSEIFEAKLLLKMPAEMHSALQEAARQERTSVSSYIRSAVEKRLKEDNVSTFRMNEDTGMPVKSKHKAKKGTAPIVRMDEINMAEIWEPVRSFMRRYVEICKRHPRLEERAISCMRLKSIDSPIPYFKRKTVSKIAPLLRSQNFDAEGVLDALDGLPWYNGDDPNATWHLANLDWIFEQKKTREEPNWLRMLSKWREKGEQKPPPKNMVIEMQVRAIVVEVAKNIGAVEGTTDWQNIYSFVKEKCERYGSELVRKKSAVTMSGPLGWAEFVKSFNANG